MAGKSTFQITIQELLRRTRAERQVFANLDILAPRIQNGEERKVIYACYQMIRAVCAHKLSRKELEDFNSCFFRVSPKDWDEKF